MKIFSRLLIFSALAGMLAFCETDFDVIADYKEVAIVYGLLNQNDSIQYLRITKAYLGEGNALTYAKIPDSSSYGADIDVRLIETTPGGQTKEIVFDTVTLAVKDTGTFYSPGQLYYWSDAKLSNEHTYNLQITNKKTGNIITSQTSLIGDFYYIKPSNNAASISFKETQTSPHEISWHNAENGKRYQLVIHFYYNELRGLGDTTLVSKDWVFSPVTSDRLDGNGESEMEFQNSTFFQFCANKIPYTEQAAEDEITSRIAAYCDLEMTVIGDEFSTYLDVNGPSSGVLAEKPVYSNINNGLGLFSSRYQIHRIIPLNSETILNLSQKDLKFAIPTK